jgi:hypothetical protein
MYRFRTSLFAIDDDEALLSSEDISLMMFASPVFIE